MTDTRQRLTEFDVRRGAESALAPGIFQWALVVPDLDRTCAELRRAYGIAGFLVMEDAPIRRARSGGVPVDVHVDIAVGFLGAVNVEVVRPRPGSGPNLYTEFLDDRPDGGLHHIGVTVFDYDAAHAELERSFGENVLTGDFATAGSRFAYFDSRPATGLCTEILYLDPATLGMMTALRAGHPPAG